MNVIKLFQPSASYPFKGFQSKASPFKDGDGSNAYKPWCFPGLVGSSDPPTASQMTDVNPNRWRTSEPP